jgi:hypothetical protein
MLRSGFPSAEAARSGMIAGYREVPYQLAPAYRALFGYLKAGAVPLVFNCAAGKDRAGTAAALLLTALGVPREIVVEDYLLTNTAYDVEASLLKKAVGHFAHFPNGVGAGCGGGWGRRVCRVFADAAGCERRGIAGDSRPSFGMSRKDLDTGAYSAAKAWPGSTISTARARSTESRREMPRSCMVTP